MGQIMAVDYGKARTGLAVTDDMQIIASALQTVETPKLMDFLGTYFQQNKVDEIVVGLPTDLKGNMSEIETEIQKFLEQFQITFPQIKINRFDERFTSKMASFFISQSGKSKKERQQKGLIDKISATLILQNFLETR
ncbi:Holliday junction resolvase RuvX [Elizabethkingia occulta]|jgi:putative Holliday junction resolvase|uniref:Putative pre-16S rRNA nuclease n=2 Tax=Elizabethkingia TaxID=308865 RepID=A0AAJ3TNQ6_9FLAO|nr:MULTISPECIES: Holliday junction resolvase RuvX [Elizabethkingia]AJW63356.1 Putative Holliday junction resolvase [Elizabethkingia miricola]MDR2229513.1 Holliday junction resolvase RuvX [Flavobacteriaceae bacterium]AQX09476.1 Holliday junction DNA helicase RuvA [Elizabethkingia ursingii]KUY30928.1 Holliday junction resolvase [Elizabethkingia ursingii]MCL1663066.1 Holliday junction resolvase RuvX [Elizabethkingia ursingii]